MKIKDVTEELKDILYELHNEIPYTSNAKNIKNELAELTKVVNLINDRLDIMIAKEEQSEL